MELLLNDIDDSFVSRKWSAIQKPNSKRMIPAPISDDYSLWTVEQLKLECTNRKLDVAKTTNKEGRVKVLQLYDENKAAVTAMIGEQRQVSRNKKGWTVDDRRAAGSMVRLVNVLFSDCVFGEFMSSGDKLTRSQLDEGGNKFWLKVADEFNADKAEYNSHIATIHVLFTWTQLIVVYCRRQSLSFSGKN